MKKFSQWEMIPVFLFRSEKNIKHFQDYATFFFIISSDFVQDIPCGELSGKQFGNEEFF